MEPSTAGSLWKLGKARNEFSCGASRRSTALPTHGLLALFWTSDFQNCDNKFYAVLSHGVCGHLLQQHEETNTISYRFQG